MRTPNISNNYYHLFQIQKIDTNIYQNPFSCTVTGGAGGAGGSGGYGNGASQNDNGSTGATGKTGSSAVKLFINNIK